ncbi:AI-2E family transporter [Patescibacteria group bacterium]|nr:AI-2E family transporter [Patescibacteria group bacterium]
MSNEKQTTLIKIDVWSILKIAIILLIAVFLYFIRDILFIIFIAGLLATIISPMIAFFERKKIPRFLGTLFVYIGVFMILALVGVTVVPTVISQGKVLSEQLPELLSSILSKIQPESQAQFADIVDKWFAKSSLDAMSIFSVLGTVAGQVLSFVMIFVLAFYLSIRKKGVETAANLLIPDKYQKFFKNFINSVQKEIGAWARGLAMLCLFVGIMVYVGLTILGVKYALTLAVIAALVEIIPYIGPWIGLLIAIIITLAQSPALVLFVVGLYLIIQQIENILISPYIMHKAVGLDPLIIILALMVGGKLAGPIGMIVAVPCATIFSILLRYYIEHKQKLIE